MVIGGISSAPLAAPGFNRAATTYRSTGPPFDPGKAGLAAHAPYLGHDSVFLVFEGEAAHTRAIQVAREHVVEVSQWQRIVSGLPSRVEDVPTDARCLYRWTAGSSS